MFHALKPLLAKHLRIGREPALDNPYVAHCIRLWQRVYDATLNEIDSGAVARLRAQEADRKAMPELRGSENIRNFIACAIYGYNAGIVFDGDTSKLLYAAQAVFSIGAPRSPKTTGKTIRKSAKSPVSNSLEKKSAPPNPSASITGNTDLTEFTL
jgi:hypothetical protein